MGVVKARGVLPLTLPLLDWGVRCCAGVGWPALPAFSRSVGFVEQLLSGRDAVAMVMPTSLPSGM
jgi:hypothetical protein